MNKELRIVILAAGKGTRMNSDLPKVLHKLNGKPLLDYVLDESELLNPREIILVVGFKKGNVISHTKNRINLKNVTQIEQLGKGHAVLQTSLFYTIRFGSRNQDLGWVASFDHQYWQ